MRAAPPEGWRAAAVLALALAGAGAKAGLVPFHAWLPLAHPAAPSHVSALMSGAMTKVAIYVLARLLLDLCGPAQPSWWGIPLLVLGAVSALLGALRANLEDDTKTLLACSTIENIGFIVLGLGLALAFRGADLGPLAALAAGAALLHALNHGVFKTLLFLVAGSVLHSAGSRKLRPARRADPCHAGHRRLRPGGCGGRRLAAAALGLRHRNGCCCSRCWRAGGSAISASRSSPPPPPRWPPWPRRWRRRRCCGCSAWSSSAGPAARAAPGRMRFRRLERAALLLPAALTLLFGLFPGVLLGLAAPALRVLTGRPAEAPARGAWLTAGEGASGYAPLAVALLLGLAFLGVALLVRRRSPNATQRGPVWNCGFIDPPSRPLRRPADPARRRRHRPAAAPHARAQPAAGA